jgi:hypothetical protein
VSVQRTLFRRLSVGVTDQLLSSGSNFLVLLLGARYLNSAGFGAFSLALLTYTFTLGIVRALCSEALLVRGGDGGAEHWPRVRSAVSATFWVGVLAGFACMAVALLASGSTARCFAVLALAIPGLLIQDTLRYAAFARAEPRAALWSDLFWLVGLIVVMIALRFTITFTAPWLLAAFVVPGVLAGLGQATIERTLPEVAQGMSWITRNGDLSGRYALDFLSGAGASQVAAYVLVVVSGVAALGSLRGAQTLFGPVNIVLTGVFTVLVPEGRHAVARSKASLTRLCVVASAVLAIGSAALLGIFLLLSQDQGQMILGVTWNGARSIIVPVGVAAIAGGALAGASAGLRSLQAASRILQIRLLIVPTTILLPTIGAIVGDAKGIAWGIAVSVWWNVIWYWWGYRRELAVYDPAAHVEAVEPDTGEPRGDLRPS